MKHILVLHMSTNSNYMKPCTSFHNCKIFLHGLEPVLFNTYKIRKLTKDFASFLHKNDIWEEDYLQLRLPDRRGRCLIVFPTAEYAHKLLKIK